MEEDVMKCGYCQAGQLMNAPALLTASPNPSQDEIENAMRGNICRCACYKRINQAIARVWEYRFDLIEPQPRPLIEVLEKFAAPLRLPIDASQLPPPGDKNCPIVPSLALERHRRLPVGIHLDHHAGHRREEQAQQEHADAAELADAAVLVRQHHVRRGPARPPCLQPSAPIHVVPNGIAQKNSTPSLTSSSVATKPPGWSRKPEMSSGTAARNAPISSAVDASSTFQWLQTTRFAPAARKVGMSYRLAVEHRLEGDHNGEGPAAGLAPA